MTLLARSACKETIRTELSFKALTTGILFHPFVLWHFYFWNTKSGLLFKYKAHAVSRVPVILHLIQVEVFRVISHWECCKCHVLASRFQTFLGEDSPRPHPPPKKLASPARVFKRSYRLKLRSAVPANDSLWVFPTKSKSWQLPSLWLLKLAISGTPH